MGYACGHTKKRGEKKTAPDQRDECVFPLIQRALKEYAKGLCTQSGLARKLDDWGLEEIRGSKTQAQLVDRLLGRNLKFYSGILVNPWTGDEHEGLHEPMISKEESEQIRLVRSGKAFTVRRDRSNPEFPLRRVVLCAGCSGPLTGSASRGNGGRYAYYHCARRGCLHYGKGIPKVRMEKDFAEYLAAITPGRTFWALLRETVVKYWADKSLQTDLSAKKWKNMMATLKERRQRVFDMREDGSYTKDEFQERRDAIDMEIAAVKNSITVSQPDGFDPVAALEYASDFLAALGRSWSELLPQGRARFQRLVLPQGIPYDRNSGFGTTTLGLIYELNQRFSASDSRNVRPAGLEPATNGLKGHCSTIELWAQKPTAWLLRGKLP